jgi:hypothetical protein
MVALDFDPETNAEPPEVRTKTTGLRVSSIQLGGPA